MRNLMFKYSKQNKYCATCDFWNGCRSVDSIFVINQIIVENANVKGICGHRRSGRWNTYMQSNLICAVWKIWSRLIGV